MTAQPDQKPWVSIPVAADMIGIHRNTALVRAKTVGHINGIPVIKATDTRFVVARAEIERALGIAPVPTIADVDPDWFDRT
jgi:hypothetical protein